MIYDYLVLACRAMVTNVYNMLIGRWAYFPLFGAACTITRPINSKQNEWPEKCLLASLLVCHRQNKKILISLFSPQNFCVNFLFWPRPWSFIRTYP